MRDLILFVFILTAFFFYQLIFIFIYNLHPILQERVRLESDDFTPHCLISSSLEFIGMNLSKQCLLFCKRSHQRCSIKIGILKYFTKFTGKHLCQSLFFNKISSLRLAILFKKRLRRRCFLVSFEKFLRTPFLQNTSGRLLLILI